MFSHRLPKLRVPSLLPIALVVLSAISVSAQIIDTTFDARLETTSFISKYIDRILVLPDGKMIATGAFNKYNGQYVGGLIRVNADGSLDTTFENDLILPPGVSSPDELKVLPDGKILVLGTFTLADGTQFFGRAIRLNPDGTLDPTFNYEPNSGSRTSLDSLGRVYVQGSALQYVRGGQTITRSIVRLNADGSVDDSFNTTAVAEGFTTQGNKIIYFVMEGGAYQVRRLNEDGSLDGSFTQTAILSLIHI